MEAKTTMSTTFPSLCSACTTRPAAYAMAGDGRCQECAPDGCQICWVWGRRCCRTHRAPTPLLERRPANDNMRRLLKIECGEHPAFVALSEGQHPMHAGPRPYDGSEDPTAVELPVVGDDAAEVA